MGSVMSSSSSSSVASSYVETIDSRRVTEDERSTGSPPSASANSLARDRFLNLPFSSRSIFVDGDEIEEEGGGGSGKEARGKGVIDGVGIIVDRALDLASNSTTRFNNASRSVSAAFALASAFLALAFVLT